MGVGTDLASQPFHLGSVCRSRYSVGASPIQVEVNRKLCPVVSVVVLTRRTGALLRLGSFAVPPFLLANGLNSLVSSAVG